MKTTEDCINFDDYSRMCFFDFRPGKVCGQKQIEFEIFYKHLERLSFLFKVVRYISVTLKVLHVIKLIAES